ncbi:MAG: porin [Pseudomonadales bacterium]|nr:porin [Pseudomonadales bacterium]
MKNHYLKKTAYCAVLAGAFASAGSMAETELNFSGFATLGYSKASIDEVDTGDNEYLDGQLNNLEGMTGKGNFRDLNRLGLRLDVPMDDKLAFTTQLIAKGSNDYDPEVDWLFVTYSFTPNISLSVGKVRTPLFMYSDYLDVGYAYQWIKPPFSVYGSPTINSTEGAKLSWIADLGGSWLSEVQVWAGQSNETLEELDDTPFTLTDQTGISWSLEREWLVLRGVYVQGKGTIITDELTGVDENIAAINAGINGVAATSPFMSPIDLTSVRTDVSYDEDKNEFLGLGIMLDFESFFIGAEASRVKSDNNLPVGDLDSYYVLTGVRLPADVTLSLTYSVDSDAEKPEIYENYNALTAASIVGIDQTIAVISDTDDILALNTLKAQTLGLGAGLETQVIERQRKERETITVGARWDFHRQAALKGEYIMQDKSIGVAEEVSPTAFRIAIDLIF